MSDMLLIENTYRQTHTPSFHNVISQYMTNMLDMIQRPFQIAHPCYSVEINGLFNHLYLNKSLNGLSHAGLKSEHNFIAYRVAYMILT